MNETCLDLLRITEELQGLIYENIELRGKVSELQKEVDSYHEFITNLNKKNMKFTGEVLEILANKK